PPHPENAICRRRLLQRLVRDSAGLRRPTKPGTGSIYYLSAFDVDARSVSGAVSICAPPAGSTGLGSVFGPPVGDRRMSCLARPRWIPFGRLPPFAASPAECAWRFAFGNRCPTTTLCPSFVVRATQAANRSFCASRPAHP